MRFLRIKHINKRVRKTLRKTDSRNSRVPAKQSLETVASAYSFWESIYVRAPSRQKPTFAVSIIMDGFLISCVCVCVPLFSSSSILHKLYGFPFGVLSAWQREPSVGRPFLNRDELRKFLCNIMQNNMQINILGKQRLLCSDIMSLHFQVHSIFQVVLRLNTIGWLVGRFDSVGRSVEIFPQLFSILCTAGWI